MHIIMYTTYTHMYTTHTRTHTSNSICTYSHILWICIFYCKAEESIAIHWFMLCGYRYLFYPVNVFQVIKEVSMNFSIWSEKFYSVIIHFQKVVCHWTATHVISTCSHSVFICRITLKMWMICAHHHAARTYNYIVIANIHTLHTVMIWDT